MSVFDHVYYPFHDDHINTPRKHPLIIPFELQMVEVSYDRGMKTGGGGYNPPGVWINHCIKAYKLWPIPINEW